MAKIETLGKLYAQELEAEKEASKKCLERILVADVYDWKPHPKSMPMGYLSVLVAEIPRWIALALIDGVIDFETYGRAEVKTSDELVEYFEKNMADAKKALESVSDKELDEDFSLKNKGQVLFTSSKKDTVSSSINHLVHHRGQLTVYMRLKEISVPPIYGSSADEKVF